MLIPSAAPGGPSIVADIGGSNARFGWIGPADTAVTHVSTFPVEGHASLADALRHYLEQQARALGSSYQAPEGAALAVATAITGDRVDFTNSPWGFSQAEFASALGLRRLVVLNDFEALALALPYLEPDQLQCRGASPSGRCTKAVIGPGTGLGVAAVTPTAQGWVAIPGEGGHATAAAVTDFESALLTWIRARHEHVSAERLLSGIGLPVLHAAVCAIDSMPHDATLDTPGIVDRGLLGDPSCQRTLDVFCALLGSFAGSVALTFGARGGVYIGGGIVPRLGEFFFRSAFRARFEAKGRLRPYLEAIPTAVVTDTLAALTGAAASLRAGPASIASE